MQQSEGLARTNVMYFSQYNEKLRLIFSFGRYTGLITGINDMDPVRWPGSKWRCLVVCTCYEVAYLP